MNNIWEQAQQHERKFWSDCRNTLGEELKQMTYARKMGLEIYDNGVSPFNISVNAETVVDIGGGPVSMLLKAHVAGTVVDPCDFPSWVARRYEECAIIWKQVKAEDYTIEDKFFDEAWCYNALQHFADPQKAVEVMKTVAKKIRIFEWVDIKTDEMHLHTLTEQNLNKWLDTKGTVEQLNENGCVGKAYYAII